MLMHPLNVEILQKKKNAMLTILLRVIVVRCE